MTNQPIGEYQRIADKHSALASRMSPSALHAAFPGKYARPLPAPDHDDKLRTEIVRLNVSIAKLPQQNKRLRMENAALVRKATIPSTPDAPPMMAAIVQEFLIALADEEQTIDGGPFTIVHLYGRGNSQKWTRPRHVAMWLCRQITGKTTSEIAALFGGRDHTAVMHAVDRAQELMEEFPMWHRISHRVLAKFNK